MDVGLVIKALIGALIVVLIQVISKTKNYYLAALVPLFPFFSLISYYIVGSERGMVYLKNTVIFGVFSLIPHFAFLATLFLCIKWYKLESSLFFASFAWCVAAIVIIVFWNKLKVG